VRQLFPDRNPVLPEGDWTFPGGGESFSGDENRRPLPSRTGTNRTGTNRTGTNRTGTDRTSATWADTPITALPPRPGASRPTAAELSLATAADEAWLASAARARFAPAPASPVDLAATGAPTTAGVPTAAEDLAAAPVPAPRPVRLTRRGRVVLIIAAVLVAAGLVVAGATAAQASGPAAAHSGDSRVFVQPGDTLWSIAQRTDPGADPQAVVTDILQANHLSTATVTVGQRLWVPRG
jgi:LysM repeat protein